MKYIVVHSEIGQPRYLIEATPTDLDEALGAELRGRGFPKPLDGLEEAGAAIAEISERLLGRVHDAANKARPDEVELTFGITMSAEAGMPLICSAGGEATFEIKAVWSKSEDGNSSE